jgi:general secretion pathway protein B
MSYILDALKRADAERERGHVPGLHSQSASLPSPVRAGQRRQRPAWMPMAAATALLLTAAAAVWWWRSAPGREASPTAAVQPPAVAPDPQPPVPTPPAAVVETPTAPPAPALPILAPPPPPPPPAPAPATTPATSPATALSNGNVRSSIKLPPPAATAPSSAPPVKVSGATYSENPSHRMLIANGKVVHEGQEIEPGLTVEVISPRSAVLNHRGSRYNINY